MNWSTDDEIPFIRTSRHRVWYEKKGVRAATYHGRHYVFVEHGKDRFDFYWTRSNINERQLTMLSGVLVALLTAILVGAYFFIRWVLRPVRWLNEGVRQVSRGNMDYRVPVKRKDELRELSEAFNTMTERIQSILQSKEQLLLDVSHELRSPLTRLKVALEMMPDSDLKEKIREDVFEMEQMIAEILETARIRNVPSALKLERTNLTDLVGGIVAEYADKPPGVDIEDGLSDFIVYIDANKIKIVLNNIVSNAVKYSKESSTPVMINLSHQAPYVIVTVIDNGISIPKEALPHIFEPFYRVDKSRSRETGGYGLGLSLCKTIMTAHQGKIAVESSPEEGTKVSLFFKDAESMTK